MVTRKTRDNFINIISEYCRGSITMNKIEEQNFLMDPMIKEITGNKTAMNTGKLSEWYFSELLKSNNIKFIEQPCISYMSCNKKRIIKPDFYLPEKDLFVEIKSRGYNCPGTASEKIDNIARKYSTKKLSLKYENSKVLVIFCAGELKQDSTMEIIRYNDVDAHPYIKNFVGLAKKYMILDLIDINDINKYI